MTRIESITRSVSLCPLIGMCVPLTSGADTAGSEDQAGLFCGDNGHTSQIGVRSGDSPTHKAQMRSSMKLRHKLERGTSAHDVDALAAGAVSACTRVNTRIGWHPGESFEISLTGQNLLTAGHFEFFDARQVIPAQVGRDIVTRLAWHF